MNYLHNRLEQLEKKLRMQRLISIFFGLAIMGGIVLGFKTSDPEFLALKKLMILDEENRPRIVLSSVKDDDGVSMACIAHFDEQGRRRFWQVTEQDIISTTYYDNEENMRLAQGVDGTNETTWVSMFEDNVSISELGWTFGIEGAYPNLILHQGNILGPRQIQLFDFEMNRRVALGTDKEGDTSLNMIDKNGVPRIISAVDSYGDTGIYMHDELFGLRWVTFLEDGAVATKMFDLNEQDRASTVIFEDGSTYLSLKNPQDEFDIVLGSAHDSIIFSVSGEGEDAPVTQIREEKSEREVVEDQGND